MKRLTIHSTPQEELAHHSERSADSLEMANQTLQELNQKDFATPQDLANVVDKLDDVSRVTQENSPKEVVSKLVTSNEKLGILEKNTKEQNDLINSLIDEVRLGALPAQLEGVDALTIGTTDMTETNELLKQISSNTLTETNRLLKELLNKEVQEIPEYPAFPEIPEPKEVDFTQTNRLLQRLIDLEIKDEEISINATLNII